MAKRFINVWGVVVGAAGSTFLLLDLIWILTVAAPMFRAVLGDVMLATPRMLPALTFYVVYLTGLCVFAIAPALRATNCGLGVRLGALFGFVCFATFDLTALALIEVYSVKLAIVDIAWGSVVSALSAFAGTYVGLVRVKAR